MLRDGEHALTVFVDGARRDARPCGEDWLPEGRFKHPGAPFLEIFNRQDAVGVVGPQSVVLARRAVEIQRHAPLHDVCQANLHATTRRFNARPVESGIRGAVFAVLDDKIAIDPAISGIRSVIFADFIVIFTLGPTESGIRGFIFAY